MPVTPDRIRQAVVIVHGMGEQRPLDTLNGFVRVALDAGGLAEPEYFSRPDDVTDSFESRRYLSRRLERPDGTEIHAQTELFEYHWAHLMQGNRLEDLWPTFRRMILLLPGQVPEGLRVVWAILWGLIIAATLLFVQAFRDGLNWGQLTITNAVGAVLGGGLFAFLLTLLLTYLLTRFTPRWLTSSFVDVVRYLDTSPRSYGVRRDIRAGIVTLLEGLHEATIRGQPRYQRIVVVAHSLGSYIAYDAISWLWGQMNELHQSPMNLAEGATGPWGGLDPGGLETIEVAAQQLDDGHATLEDYRHAQRAIWTGLRNDGNPWRITDFVSFGSPMYFADRLLTENREKFQQRVRRRDLPQCPPLPDEGDGYPNRPDRRRLSYNNGGRRVLYHGAPFAVVRWTNLWFPPGLRFFGDWFGGRLAPLFGNGVNDVCLTGNLPKRWTPGGAHAFYLSFPTDVRPESVTTQLRAAMDLASSAWARPPGELPEPDPTSRGAYVPPRDDW
jgi:hypothetical protein